MATVLLTMLHDPDVQRLGVVIVSDMRGLGLRNLDPGVPKMVFGKVLSSMPVRVGRIVLFSPPWIVGNVLFPILMTFMSAKLKERIVMIKDSDTSKLAQHFPTTSLPEELGGSSKFDASDFFARVSNEMVLVDDI